MASCVFFFPFFSPSFHSAAAQHLRMQNEQASETVAMVIVTRLIVTRILIEAHTATRLLGRPSRWKQQQLMDSLLNRVSGCTLFLTSWRCLTDSSTTHCLYFMHREHAWSVAGVLSPAAPLVQMKHILHRRSKSTLLSDAVVLLCSTLYCRQRELCFKKWCEGTRVEGGW